MCFQYNNIYAVIGIHSEDPLSLPRTAGKTSWQAIRFPQLDVPD